MATDQQITLEVVTPERRVLELQVDEVVFPSSDGYMGILAGHAPLLALVDIGELSYRVGKIRSFLAVSSGYAEVLRDSVSIMAQTSEKAEEIDLARAERAKQRAETELKGSTPEDGFRHAELRLKRAISRIGARRRLGS